MLLSKWACCANKNIVTGTAWWREAAWIMVRPQKSRVLFLWARGQPLLWVQSGTLLTVTYSLPLVHHGSSWCCVCSSDVLVRGLLNIDRNVQHGAWGPSGSVLQKRKQLFPAIIFYFHLPIIRRCTHSKALELCFHLIFFKARVAVQSHNSHIES